jgi:hypothetical protein
MRWNDPGVGCANRCLPAYITRTWPYAGLNIAGVTGISDAQKASLRALGAVEGA